MTISLVTSSLVTSSLATISRIIGAACACTTLLVLASTPSPAAVQSAPLSLSPAARAAPKAAPAIPAAPKIRHESKAFSMSLKRPTIGNADLAFLSASQYLDLSADDSVIPIVAENEFSPLDFSAGIVRVVSPDELTEIDLANDPDVRLAQRAAASDTPVVQQASAAPNRNEDSDEDDGILNRILMTFAGALAMAGAMRMILA